jgi:hypothetical protein
MPIIKFTDDQFVKRLRWVMVGAILFSVVLTLAGQPDSFWQHPETAMRGDGLSIYNATNHTFEFFLGQGWQAFILASMVYISAAFVLVSILPRTTALIVIFSFILGHSFGATNWLSVRWHLGTNSGLLYILVVAPMALLAFPNNNPNADQIIKRLRWVMVSAMALDMTNTLLGQPPSYWHHPETPYESNPISYFFLARGWYAYVLWDLFYFSGVFWLVSVLSQRWALICISFFTLTGFVGGSCWYFYVWRMGMEAPVIYGIALSVIIVLSAFYKTKNSSQELNSEPVDSEPIDKTMKFDLLKVFCPK